MQIHQLKNKCCQIALKTHKNKITIQLGDKRSQRELELEAIEVVYKPKTIEKANPNEEIAKDQFTGQGGLEKIRQLEEEISKYEGQKIKGAKLKRQVKNPVLC